MEGTCSICLKNQNDLTYTEETNADDVKWSTKLTSCVPELEWNECMICQSCKSKLEMVCDFRKLCFQSYVVRKRGQERDLKYESDSNSNDGTLDSDDLHPKLDDEDPVQTKTIESSGDVKFEASKLRDVKSFQCKICMEVLDSRKALLAHVEAHNFLKVDSKSSRVVCFHCNESFAEKSSLSNHIQVCHGGGGGDKVLKRCKICNGDFDDRGLENHLIDDHGIGKVVSSRKIKKYKCDKCLRMFTTEKIMNIHVTNCHGVENESKIGITLDVDVTTENLCFDDNWGTKFDDCNSGVKTTTKKTSEEKPKLKRGRKPKEKQINKCETCSVIFTTRYLLNRHVRNVHATEKLHNCDICGQKFASPVYLSAHKRYHSRERPHICSFCGKGYITASDLYHHEKIHANKRAYKCEKCPKAFNTSSDLHKHKICVHVDRSQWKYVCSFCDRRFPLKTNLDTHTKTHTGERNFACHLCERRCINRSVLLRHIESHSNVRSFRCYVCSQEYKYQKSLDIHMTKAHGIGDAKIPERVKKYFCHICPKSYFANNKLQKHIRTHTGERPFACELCEKRFIDKSYMKQHLKTAHNVTFMIATDFDHLKMM